MGMFASCLFGVVVVGGLIAGPVLFVLGLLGQRDASLPRCRRCRHSLTATAMLPRVCPGCGVELQKASAIGFGGWRIRHRHLWRGLVLLLVGGVLIGAITYSRVTNTGGQRMVNGVWIVPNLTVADLDAHMASAAASRWEWLEAHVVADALAPEVRRRAGELTVDSIVAGDDPTARLQLLRMLGDDFDAVRLADHLADACVEFAESGVGEGGARPEITVNRARGTVSILVNPPIGAELAWGPVKIVYALLEVRADGVPLPPSRPTGRVAVSHGAISVLFSDPTELVATASRFEVDLAFAVYREPDDAFRRGVPGPIDSWPAPLAMREVTVDFTPSPGG